MDEKIPKIIVPLEVSDPREDKQELKPDPINDKDSGQGTASKSSGSVSQASDSTSGIEVKYDEADEKPLISNSPLNPEPSTSWAATGASPKKSPKKSPGRKVQEGLSWVKKHLSPKKKCRSGIIESSDSPKVATSPRKLPQDSPKISPQNSPKKSPQKTPKKPSFRLKLKSPSKREKCAPTDEVQPFLEGDELRHYSSSDEDQKTAVNREQASKQGAIPKARRLKKCKDRNSKPNDQKSTAFKKKDRTIPDKAAKAARAKLKEKVRKSIAKRFPPVEPPVIDDFEKFERYPKPCSSRQADGTWSQPRCTTDEEHTGTPSEIDLSSLSSYKFADFSDPAESRQSPAVEQTTKSLDLLDPAAKTESNESANSLAKELERRLNLTNPNVPSGGECSASQVNEIPETSSVQVPQSDSGRQAEPENDRRGNLATSQNAESNTFYNRTRSNRTTRQVREVLREKNQRKKERKEKDSDKDS